MVTQQDVIEAYKAAGFRWVPLAPGLLPVLTNGGPISTLPSKTLRCKRGHLKLGDNLYRYQPANGAEHRVCKRCRYVRQKRWRLNKSGTEA